MADFNEWLKGQLQANNINLIEFSEKIGYSYETVRSWVSGRHVPKYDAFLDIIDSLGYEIELKRKEA